MSRASESSGTDVFYSIHGEEDDTKKRLAKAGIMMNRESGSSTNTDTDDEFVLALDENDDTEYDYNKDHGTFSKKEEEEEEEGFESVLQPHDIMKPNPQPQDGDTAVLSEALSSSLMFMSAHSTFVSFPPPQLPWSSQSTTPVVTSPSSSTVLDTAPTVTFAVPDHHHKKKKEEAEEEVFEEVVEEGEHGGVIVVGCASTHTHPSQHSNMDILPSVKPRGGGGEAYVVIADEEAQASSPRQRLEEDADNNGDDNDDGVVLSPPRPTLALGDTSPQCHHLEEEPTCTLQDKVDKLPSLPSLDPHAEKSDQNADKNQQQKRDTNLARASQNTVEDRTGERHDGQIQGQAQQDQPEDQPLVASPKSVSSVHSTTPTSQLPQHIPHPSTDKTAHPPHVSSNHSQPQPQTIRPIHKQQQQQQQHLWRGEGRGEKRPTIRCFAFNQEYNCVSLGTDVGYRVRTIPPATPLLRDCRIQQGGASQSEKSPGGGFECHQGKEEEAMIHDCLTTTPTHNSQTANNKPTPDPITSCKMLHRTSLLAIVQTSDPRCLLLKNAYTHAILCKRYFTAAVRRVEMNRRHLVVFTANGKLHLFDLASMTLLRTVEVCDGGKEQVSRDAGMAGRYFDLSKYGEESWLGYRNAQEVGGVVLLNLGEVGGNVCGCSGNGGGGGRNEKDGPASVALAAAQSRMLRITTKVKAHDHPIVCIAIGGQRGRQHMATSSEKGTVIRIYNLPQCEKLHTLWRGSNPCTIYSMAFNDHASRVAVLGSSGTVHVYDLARAAAAAERQRALWKSSTKEQGPSQSPQQQQQQQQPQGRRQNTIGSSTNTNSGGGVGRKMLDVMTPGRKLFMPGSMTDKTDSVRSFAKVKIKSEVLHGPSPRCTIALLQCRPPKENWYPEDGAVMCQDSVSDCLLVLTEEGKLYQFLIHAGTAAGCNGGGGSGSAAGGSMISIGGGAVVAAIKEEDLLQTEDDQDEVGNGIMLDM